MLSSLANLYVHTGGMHIDQELFNERGKPGGGGKTNSSLSHPHPPSQTSNMLSRSTMLVSLVLGLSSVAHAGIPSYVTKPTATSVVYALPYETATPTKAVVRRADFPTSLTKPAIIGGGYGTLPYETATKAIGRRADFTTVLPASAVRINFYYQNPRKKKY